jgi:hypothetical protein
MNTKKIYSLAIAICSAVTIFSACSSKQEPTNNKSMQDSLSNKVILVKKMNYFNKEGHPTRSVSFEYDQQNRIISTLTESANLEISYISTFRYDSVGNLIAFKEGKHSEITYIHYKDLIVSSIGNIYHLNVFKQITHLGYNKFLYNDKGQITRWDARNEYGKEHHYFQYLDKLKSPFENIGQKQLLFNFQLDSELKDTFIGNIVKQEGTNGYNITCSTIDRNGDKYPEHYKLITEQNGIETYIHIDFEYFLK